MSNKKTKLTSPAAIAVYPRLNRPDTKYHELGTYSADVRLDMSLQATKDLLNTISAEYKAHTGSAHPKKPIRKDKEAVFYFEQNEDGSYIMDTVILKLRAKNVRVKKTGEIWDRKPKLFDSKGKPLNAEVKVGGGSTLKVAFEIDLGTVQKTGDKFCRLIPTAVQVINLVEYGTADDASAYGFGEEDGYDAPDATSSEFPENPNNDKSETQSEDADESEGFY